MPEELMRTPNVVLVALLTVALAGCPDDSSPTAEDAGVPRAEDGGDVGTTPAEPLDRSSFEQFVVTRRSVFSPYGALAYANLSTRISRAAPELSLEQSTVVMGPETDGDCLDEPEHGYCVMEHRFAARELTEAEIRDVEVAFRALQLEAPTDADTEHCSLVDPSFIVEYAWDGESYSGFECDEVHLAAADVEAIETLIAALQERTCSAVADQETTLRFEVFITDYRGDPFEGVQVRCAGDDEILATSDADGRLSFVLDVRGTLPCGFTTCDTLVYTHPTEMNQELELGLQESYGQDIALRRD